MSETNEVPKKKSRAVIKHCNPKYPRQAALDEIEGRVVMQFEITEEGRPINIQVIESDPPGIFDANAVSAISCWRFEPSDTVTKAVLTQDFKL